MKRIFLITLVLTMMMAFGGCGEANEASPNMENAEKQDGCYQIATLQSLTAGNFGGYEKIEDLLLRGDFGLGTFEGVNGEMIVLDGVCYQAFADGSIAVADMETTTPFSCVKWFEEDSSFTVDESIDTDKLKEELNKHIEKTGLNGIYACRIDGEFTEVQARSENAQKKPYKTLVEVLAVDQTEFTFNDIEGTIVGIFMPDYMDGVNAPGWHFHFISKDRDKGGHVFIANMKKGKVSVDMADGINIVLPQDADFQNLNLNDVSQEDIQSVEMESNK